MHFAARPTFLSILQNRNITRRCTRVAGVREVIRIAAVRSAVESEFVLDERTPDRRTSDEYFADQLNPVYAHCARAGPLRGRRQWPQCGALEPLTRRARPAGVDVSCRSLNSSGGTGYQDGGGTGQGQGTTGDGEPRGDQIVRDTLHPSAGNADDYEALLPSA
jgi:hypothetical protein